MSKYTSSQQVIKDTKQYVGKAQYAGLYGIALDKAFDNSVTDIEGNTYIDFLSGASAALLGYSRKDIIDVYGKTAEKIVHSCFVYSPNIGTIEFAKKLIEITPGKWPKKVLIGLSASDSIDGAIKAARKYTKKMGVVAFQNAYHGNTGLSAQATGFPGIRNGFLENKEFFFLDFPIDSESAEKTLKTAEELFKTQDIACFIVEPIQGDGGNLVPPIDFFHKLSELGHRYSVVLIDDETQSGVGRTGKWWAIEHFGVEPDILVTGKGLGGGYVPISACIGKTEIIDVLDKAQHVFTFSGHPPSCAVAMKVLSIIESENILESTKEKGNFFKRKIEEVLSKYKSTIDVDVRGIGLQLGISFKHPTQESLATLFAVRLLEKGIYAGYFGKNNDVIRVHPPLTITKEEISLFVKALDEVFQEWLMQLIPSETYKRYHQQCLGLGK